jgi:hypothetical protein
MLLKAKSTLFLMLMLVLGIPALADRTPLRSGWNIFTVQQDIEMGQALTTEAQNTLTFASNTFAHGYINALGTQLATHAPGPKLPWAFRIYADPAINSYVLPGGTIYVSSGLVNTAQTEPQLATVLAHQIAHVVLRHGTQQASYAYTNGRTGARPRVSVPDAMATLDIGFYPESTVLRFSPQAENEADVIATQILYDARFDPRVMATFMQRLYNQRTGDAAELVGAHPNVANRAANIRRELTNLGPLPANLRGDSPDLHTTQRNLTAEMRGRFVDDRLSSRDDDFIRGRDPALPSTRTIVYDGRDLAFRYPDNWRVSETVEGITVAPSGGSAGGELAYGMRIATFEPRNTGFFGQNSLTVPGGQGRNRTSLSSATNQLMDELRRSNPAMRVVQLQNRNAVDGQPAMYVEATNNSPVGGREVDWIVTVLRPDGTLQYFLGVAPERDINRYTPAFEQIVSSTRLPL